MSITKNSLLFLLLAVIVFLFLYFYAGFFIDSVLKEKFSINDWPGLNNFGWVPALITFSVGVLIGGLFFRRKF